MLAHGEHAVVDDEYYLEGQDMHVWKTVAGSRTWLVVH